MTWSYAWNTSRMLSETFRVPLGETNTYSMLTSMYDNRWTPETAYTATLPRATLVNKSNNYENSDLFLVDADYLRLKNVEISYMFDRPIIKKIKLNNLRIFVNGYNLLTFDKLKISDPESKTAENKPEYPVMQVYNVGLKLNF